MTRLPILHPEAEVTHTGILDMQVCVPWAWVDGEVEAFAERKNPCGTTHGWQIRKDGNPRLDGDPERVDCASRPGFAHVMLEC